VSEEQPDGAKHDSDGSRARRLRIPGFDAGTEIGLGDVIKRTTSLAGVPPCRSCSQRAAHMNRWLVFSGRR